MNYFTTTEKTFGGEKKVFCVNCLTEHGWVILKAPTLEELEKSYNYYNMEKKQ